MDDTAEIADQPKQVAIASPQLLAKAFRTYQRFHATIEGADGIPVEQQRDVLRGGKAVAVLPIDVARDEIVLLRQFRLAAHLANGQGELVEVVAGRVEADETPEAAARRECAEEIGVAATHMVELFSYLSTPGLTDEEIIVFVAAVDASRALEHPNSPDGEQIRTMRVPIAAALAALAAGRMRFAPTVIALQWLALNRGRIATLLGGADG